MCLQCAEKGAKLVAADMFACRRHISAALGDQGSYEHSLEIHMAGGEGTASESHTIHVEVTDEMRDDGLKVSRNFPLRHATRQPGLLRHFLASL